MVDGRGGVDPWREGETEGGAGEKTSWVRIGKSREKGVREGVREGGRVLPTSVCGDAASKAM